jgi:cell division septum initiation protein DivIVA
MATKARRKGSKSKGGARGAMSREAKAAYTEIQKGVKRLEQSIADIRRGLGKAEKRIEADARQRIRRLRAEARTQVKVLQSKEREAAKTLKNLSAAAGDSWREIKRSADSILDDARSTASSIVDRFRSALRT